MSESLEEYLMYKENTKENPIQPTAANKAPGIWRLILVCLLGIAT
jgi:hypothetical protein